MDWKRLSSTGILLIATLLLMPSLVAFSERDPLDDVAPGVVHVDEEEAFAHDVSLMAEQTELSMDEAERTMRFQEAFTLYGMEMLLPRYEHEISAIWTAPAPATRGYVRFVGEVPQEAISDAASRSLDIVFLGGGEITMAQHDLRSDLAAEALIDAGFDNLLVYPDREGGTININLRVVEGTQLPDKADIVLLVTEGIATYRAGDAQRGPLEGRAAEIRSTDLILSVIVSSAPFAEPAATRGGNRVKHVPNGNLCTSGLTVSGNAGQGIITAAHCSVNTFVETSGAQYTLNHVAQAGYAFGDVEYQTSPSQLDYAEFYSTPVEIRDVTLVKATSTMVGQGVCVYGRSSNFRSCAHTVKATNVTVSVGGIGPVSKQAWATGSSGVTQGDSGGGWSTNTWA